jgi:hypothetical protein
MKKLLLILFISAFTYGAFAQTTPVKDGPKEEYCMIVATQKVFSTKVNIAIDHGQATKLFGGSDQNALKDEEGKILTFNSVIDALNYMAQQGWYFVNAYSLANADKSAALYYILRRPLK